MKFSTSAALVLLVCVACVHATTATARSVHPWRPTHRPLKTAANSNYNVNVNTNKNSNDNAIFASLLSQLFEGNQYPCVSCNEKKATLKSDETAAAAVQPTETAVEKEAAVLADFDFNFEQFQQPQTDDADEFEEAQDDDFSFE